MPRNTATATPPAPATTEEQVLTEFSRPRGSKISVRTGTGRDGGVYYDLRESYQADDGEWRFTRKGVRLSAEEFAAVKAL